MTFSRTVRGAAIGAIAAWFLFLTKRALIYGFNYDDMMNLHRGWMLPRWELLLATVAFWTDHIRPLGDLWYVAVFELFGFNPRPFHAAAFVVLVPNVALVYLVLRRISQRDDLACAASLIAAFHGSCWAIYSSTGSIYDILAQSFVLLSLLLYIGRHRPGPWFFLTVLLAIGSKEMGLVTPALLAGHDLIYRRRLRWQPFAAAVLPAVYLISRLAFPNQLSGHVAYTPVVSLSRYLETMSAYTRFLLFDRVPVSGVAAIVALIAALGLALALRSRHMVYGWLYYVVALVPMAFVTPRDNGYPLYIPLTGVALYLVGWIPPRLPWLAALLAGVAAFGQLKMMQSIERRLHWSPPTDAYISATASQISALVPAPKPGARFLLVDDPFGADVWQPLYILRLRYRDRDLDVERIHSGTSPSLPYDYIVVWDGRAYRLRDSLNGDAAKPRPTK